MSSGWLLSRKGNGQASPDQAARNQLGRSMRSGMWQLPGKRSGETQTDAEVNTTLEVLLVNGLAQPRWQ